MKFSSILICGRTPLRRYLLVVAATLTFSSPTHAIGFDLGLGWDGEWSLKSGQVSYRVKHVMHNAEGICEKPKLKMTCDGSCRFEVRSQVADFRTKEPERDEKMREVTRSEKFPEVVVNGQTSRIEDDYANADLNVNFAGHSVPYKNVRLKIKKSWREASFSGEFDIRLSEYEVERPRLIGVPIDDDVRIRLEFKIEKK